MLEYALEFIRQLPESLSQVMKSLLGFHLLHTVVITATPYLSIKVLSLSLLHLSFSLFLLFFLSVIVSVFQVSWRSGPQCAAFRAQRLRGDLVSPRAWLTTPALSPLQL